MEYESGGFYNGHDYCTACMLSVKAKDDAKKRAEEERLQKIINDRRKVARITIITETQEKYRKEREELKRRRTMEEMRRREMMEAARQAEDQKIRKRHELIHQATYGRAGSNNFSLSGTGQSAYDAAGVLPLDQQHRSKTKPAKVEKKEPRSTSGWSSHSTTEFHLEVHGAPSRHEFPLSLSVEESLPSEIEAGRASRAVLIGKNAAAKKIEVMLNAALKGEASRQCSLEVEPKKCFIEAGGEARFEVKITPLKGLRGALLLEAYLKENAFYIDPEQGRSEELSFVAKIKGK
jgi:hypothetical protein